MSNSDRTRSQSTPGHLPGAGRAGAGTNKRQPEHVPVLLETALTGLSIQPEGIYIDGTYGRGGHSRAILGRLGPKGRLLAVDRDPEAIASARRAGGIADDPRVTAVHAGFENLDELAKEAGVHGRVGGVLLDLGVSSPQLDTPERGFSFREDGPLDMRMDPTTGESAADWLARASEDDIARVIKEYGEERHARRIARSIAMAGRGQRIERTAQLAEIVARAVGRHSPDRHPATRTFQAIRIHVNRELDALERALEAGIDLLAPGGRFAVISFHSLEDRLVKRRFISESRPPPASRRLPRAREFSPRLKVVGKMIRPGSDEQEANPRARSARLRVAEKL